MTTPFKRAQTLWPPTCHNQWMSEEFVPGWASVIIPTFSRAGMITEALDSVWAQNYRPIEVIVVDDGSTDKTSEVIKRWSKQYADDPQFELRYFRQKNSGAPTARNRGLIESKGEFIQMLDSDDALLPEKFSKSATRFHEGAAIDMVYGPYIVDFGNGQHELDFFLPQSEVSPSFATLMTNAHKLWTAAPMHRRRSVLRAGPWDESLLCCQDVEWHPRVMLQTRLTAQLDAPLAIYRRHGEETISRKRIFNPAPIKSRVRATVSISKTLEIAGLKNKRASKYLASNSISCARSAIPAGAGNLTRTILLQTKQLWYPFQRYRIEAAFWRMISYLPPALTVGTFKALSIVKTFATRLLRRFHRVKAMRQLRDLSTASNCSNR